MLFHLPFALCRTALLALPLALLACASPEQQAAQAARIETADHSECVRLGFPQGTPEYGDCRLRLREMRLQERLVNRPVYFDPYFGPRMGVIYR
jgi:hypothetical protein